MGVAPPVPGIPASALGQPSGVATLTPAGVAQYVNARAPRISDDINSGYNVGHLWNAPGMGLWQCQGNAPGAAAWTRLLTNLKPLDSIPSDGVQAAYGTRLLREGYTGPCMQVTTGSTYTFSGNSIVITYGSTLTNIGFDAQGNLDVHALAAAIGASLPPTDASGPQFTCALVTTWYDQSGNARHATATPANAPTITPHLAASDGVPFINFVNGGLTWLTYNLDSSLASAIVQCLTIPSGLAWNSQNVSIIASLRNTETGATTTLGGVNPLVSLAGTYAYTVYSATGTLGAAASAAGGAGVFVGALDSFPFFLPASQHIFGVTNTTVYLSAFNDDNNTYQGTAALASTGTGGFIGATSTTSGGGAMSLDALIIGPAISAVDMATLRAAMTDTFRGTPQVRDRWICNGDSVGAGAEGSFGMTPQRQAESHFDRPFICYNVAVGGGTVGGTGSASRLATFGTTEATLYSPYGKCLFQNEGGINDIGTGTTPAALYAEMTSWISRVHALGANARAIVSTLFPHPSISPDSLRVTYNGLVFANAGGADIIDDVTQIPFLGVYANLSNRLYFAASGHHHGLGQALEAPFYADAVNRAARS
jgi:hypothetical protein